MKTIKISEKTHKQLTSLQNMLYIKLNEKYTFDEIISLALVDESITCEKRYGK